MIVNICFCILVVLISPSFAAVLSQSSFTEDSVICPSGWVDHMDVCYLFSHDQETWADAVIVCKLLGGKLAEINSAPVGTFLSAMVMNKTGHYWIAGNDLQEEGSWMWVNSKALISNDGYTNWGPVEPNNYGGHENCLEIYHPNGKWYDDSCGNLRKYICEMEPESKEGQILG